ASGCHERFSLVRYACVGGRVRVYQAKRAPTLGEAAVRTFPQRGGVTSFQAKALNAQKVSLRCANESPAGGARR
ncbi:MAG: hypothetical protein OXC14_05220, partial [Rhodospirillaceae bacterium]|nr:hypothetical protein [Rhodospirillaceae bacterium]